MLRKKEKRRVPIVTAFHSFFYFLFFSFCISSVETNLVRESSVEDISDVYEINGPGIYLFIFPIFNIVMSI